MVDVRPPFPAGHLWFQHEDDGAVLHLDGEVDIAAVLAFERASQGTAQLAHGGAVAVDASAVTFISCAGIACMLLTTSQLRDRGRRPVLRNPSWPVLRVLQLLRLLDAFDIVDRLTSC